MAELQNDSQNNDSQITEPMVPTPRVPTPESAPGPQEPNPVCDSWQQLVQGVLAVVMFVGALAMVHYYAPMAAQSAPPDDLQKQVHDLSAQVERLKQDQDMPALVLDRYRNSIG